MSWKNWIRLKWQFTSFDYFFKLGEVVSVLVGASDQSAHNHVCTSMNLKAFKNATKIWIVRAW